MPNQHERIADLESEIDALRDEAERCRKIDIVAKLAFGLGCIILFTAFVRSSAFALVIGSMCVLLPFPGPFPRNLGVLSET